MIKDCVIRRAEPVLDDARALLAVEHETLGDSSYSPRKVVSILDRPEHHAYLAFEGEEAVGFCSCIQTPLGEGGQLEIDILGVLSEHRCKGIGSALVAGGVHEAVARGVRRYRAVVAEDNLSSKRTFQSLGFTQIAVAEMMVYQVRGRAPVEFLPPSWQWQIRCEGRCEKAALSQAFDAHGLGHEVHHMQDENGGPVAAAECLQVQTMAYKGFWVEGFEVLSHRATGYMARALAERAKELDVDEVGYLVPRQGADDALIPLVAAGYENVGTYVVLCGDATTVDHD
jgi:ribosomal protein S18 acetylase RimI-like enzyme